MSTLTLHAHMHSQVFFFVRHHCQFLKCPTKLYKTVFAWKFLRYYTHRQSQTHAAIFVMFLLCVKRNANRLIHHKHQ